VVLISGSGAQDRDETVAGHKPFLVLSDHLTRRGYAVLRFDDRSTGMQTTLDQTADDVEGAVAHLRSLSEIDATRIGLLGHSEGGYVAPLIASRDRRIAALILLGAPAVSGHDVFLAQSSAMLRASGAAEDEVRVDSLIRATVFAVMRRSPADTGLARLVDSATAHLVQRLSPDDRKRADTWFGARTPAQDSSAFMLWRSPWFKSLLRHDAEGVLGAVDLPVLAIYGTFDLQVPASPNVAALERVFRARNSSRLTTRLLPGVNHMMQPATSGAMDQYRLIEQTIAEPVLAALDAWLAKHMPVASAR
jgi:pimeloyl-ACP methyl ester carboxylesterase